MEAAELGSKQRKRKVLIIVGIAQVIANLAIVLTGRFEGVSSLITILSAVGWAVGILSWVKIDSEERETEVSSGFRIALVILGFFALCYYLFRSRGLVGGLKGIGWTLLYFLAVMLVYFVLAFVMFLAFALTGNKLT